MHLLPLKCTLKLVKITNLIFYYVYSEFTTIKPFLSSCENVPAQRLKVPGKLLPGPTCPPPHLGQCRPRPRWRALSYFQPFPGAYYSIRQSFPVSQNPRQSWYQTFPAAPEVHFPLVSECFVRPGPLTRLSAPITSSPSARAEGTPEPAGQWTLRAS